MSDINAELVRLLVPLHYANATNLRGLTVAKRYYWMKLSTDFVRQLHVLQMERTDKGLPYIYIKLLLSCIDSDGKIITPTSIETDLSLIANCQKKLIAKILPILKSHNLIKIEENNAYIVFTEARLLTGSESEDASRMRNKRSEQRTYNVQKCTSNVRNRTYNREHCSTESESEIESDLESESETYKQHVDVSGEMVCDANASPPVSRHEGEGVCFHDQRRHQGDVSGDTESASSDAVGTSPQRGNTTAPDTSQPKEKPKIPRRTRLDAVCDASDTQGSFLDTSPNNDTQSTPNKSPDRNVPSKNPQNKKSIPKHRQADFEKVYTEYKGCTRTKRYEAIKSWDALVKTNSLPSIDELVEAVQAYNASVDPEFKCGLQVWLNQHRWEDLESFKTSTTKSSRASPQQQTRSLEGCDYDPSAWGSNSRKAMWLNQRPEDVGYADRSGGVYYFAMGQKAAEIGLEEGVDYRETGRMDEARQITKAYLRRQQEKCG